MLQWEQWEHFVIWAICGAAIIRPDHWIMHLRFYGDQSILSGYKLVFICVVLSKICLQLFSDCQWNNSTCNNLAVFPDDCQEKSLEGNKRRLVTHAPHCPGVGGPPWKSQVIVRISCNDQNIKCNNKMHCTALYTSRSVTGQTEFRISAALKLASLLFLFSTSSGHKRKYNCACCQRSSFSSIKPRWSEGCLWLL